MKALRERQPGSELLARFVTVARVLTGKASADIEEGIAFVEELGRELSVPGLAAYGMRSADIREVAAKAAAASSMKGNPLVLSASELEAILEAAL